MPTRKSKAQIFDLAKKAAQDPAVYFINDIVAELPVGRTKFYELFPVDTTEREELDDMLERNKMRLKKEIREKLKAGKFASELLPLYRLVATAEERRALNTQYVEADVTERPIFKGHDVSDAKD